MRVEEISLESIALERPDARTDSGAYNTVTFRVLPPDHPSSFVVPIAVNLAQYPPGEIETHARFVFHRMMKAFADATSAWDRPDPRH
jgi:hypothetical protein